MQNANIPEHTHIYLSVALYDWDGIIFVSAFYVCIFRSTSNDNSKTETCVNIPFSYINVRFLLILPKQYSEERRLILMKNWAYILNAYVVHSRKAIFPGNQFDKLYNTTEVGPTPPSNMENYVLIWWQAIIIYVPNISKNLYTLTNTSN